MLKTDEDLPPHKREMAGANSQVLGWEEDATRGSLPIAYVVRPGVLADKYGEGGRI